MTDDMNSTRFAEVERLLDLYFKLHICPIMDSTRVTFAKEKEEKDAQTRLHGRGIRIAGTPFGDALTRMGLINEWSNQSAEDYLNASLAKVSSSPSMQHDLTLLADEWRQAAIAAVGQQRYDVLCASLDDHDLATEYVNYRVTRMAFDKMVDDRVPRSSMEYVIGKIQNESAVTQLPLLAKRGLNLAFTGADPSSALQEEIRATKEDRYAPSHTEKVAAYGGTLLVDAAFLRTASLSSFASMVGVDLAARGGFSLYDHLRGADAAPTVTVEQLLSKGLFGSDDDVFPSLRAQGVAIDLYEDSYLTSTNTQLSNKVMASDPYTPPSITDLLDEQNKKIDDFFYRNYAPLFAQEEQTEQAEDTFTPSNVPPQENEPAETLAHHDDVPQEEAVIHEAPPPVPHAPAEQQASSDGWTMDKLLSYVGLDDIFTGDASIGKNFGYTLAMLPDMLIGLLTGKTHSLNLKNAALPLAAILGASFVRNPLLKMLLLMIGGGNLFNKLAHESLEGTGLTQPSPQTRYKVYADEPLNARLANPLLRGNSLIIDIDHVPCTIQLSPTVVDAYRAGALPLNTLANAIVAQNTLFQQTISRNFEQSQQDEEVSRSRGIL